MNKKLNKKQTKKSQNLYMTKKKEILDSKEKNKKMILKNLKNICRIMMMVNWVKLIWKKMKKRKKKQKNKMNKRILVKGILYFNYSEDSVFDELRE